MSKLLGYLCQRFSLHDGPGIRSTLFLKGCPLRCKWCQNPESLSKDVEMSFNINYCIDCGLCGEFCDFGAIILDGNQRIDFDKCVNCGDCASVCPNGALELIGWEKGCSEIVDDLLRDRSFFTKSGGVTISGGEPLLQSSSLKDLLMVLKRNEVHTLIETSAHVPWSRFEDVIQYTDDFFIDLKTSKGTHEEFTGVKQEDFIIPNIQKLLLEHPEKSITLRIPVIPNFNDQELVINDISMLMKEELGVTDIQLLEYHRMYESKIENIDTDQSILDIEPNEDSLFRVQKYFQNNGINAYLPEDLDPENNSLFEKPKMTDRVYKLLDEVKNGDFVMCVERVKNVTDFYKNIDKENDGSSSQIIRAKMLDYLLEKKSKKIYCDELIVGNYASQRVSGNLYMELHGLGVIEDLLSFDRRVTNPWKLTWWDRWEIIKSIPFWLRNNVLVKELGFLKFLKLADRLMKGYDFVLNEAGGFVHFCPSYERLLATGTKQIADEVRQKISETDDNSRKDFYESVIISCEALEKMAESYACLAEELAKKETTKNSKRREELLDIAKTCRRVPALPPTNLQEALQCIIFYQIGMMQEAIDLGIAPGRLDIVLYPYYKMTKDQNIMNDEEIMEALCCFWIKLGEVIPLFNDRITNVHGGLFNGQTINVGGIDKNGIESTNELSYMFMEVADAMRTRMPNFYVRYNEKTIPKKLLHRTSRMIRDGAAMPALANDPVLIEMLHEKRNVELEDARDYILLGCVEPVICGKSYFSTDTSLNNLPLCLERVLHSLLYDYNKSLDDSTFSEFRLPQNTEELFDLYQREVESLVEEMLQYQKVLENALQNFAPTPLTSITMDGCLENGVDCSFGGAKYNGSGHQGVGASDVGDCFSAVEKVVFEDQRCSLVELVEEMMNNFESEKGQVIRGYLLRAPKYGNDDPEADKWMSRVIQSFSDLLTRRYNERGGRHVAGWYSVTIHEAFGRNVGSLPSGRLSGQPFASGISPTNGSCIEGPTASLGSASRIDVIDYAGNGVNFNLSLQDSCLPNKLRGVETVQALLEGYFTNEPKGIQVQCNVVDVEVLKEARGDNSKHPNLLVRVSGYSAYFRDLSPMVQDEIIDRYCKKNYL